MNKELEEFLTDFSDVPFSYVATHTGDSFIPWKIPPNINISGMNYHAFIKSEDEIMEENIQEILEEIEEEEKPLEEDLDLWLKECDETGH